MEKQQFSFLKGWGLVQQNDSKQVKAEIMKALKIKTRASWGQRLRGDIEPRVSEAKAIEAIFAKRSITEIWGE
jgi:hypothetical protein